jgi:hypothetical protein
VPLEIGRVDVFPPRHPAIASETVPVVGEIAELGGAKLTAHAFQGFHVEQLASSGYDAHPAKWNRFGADQREG